MELIKILDMGQGYLFEVKIKSKGVHAHIYTDTIKRSSELQKEIDEYLHSLYKRLKSEGKIIPFSLSNTPEEIGWIIM